MTLVGSLGRDSSWGSSRLVCFQVRPRALILTLILIQKGCIYLISMYYERYELQWRLSLFFSASIIAGAFGGLLAYGLVKMDGLGGYEGFRWIFIIEGLATAVIGALSKFWIVDWPETAKFLTDDERAMLIRKLAVDVGDARMDRLDSKSIKRTLLDWKIWCGTLYVSCGPSLRELQ